MSIVVPPEELMGLAASISTDAQASLASLRRGPFARQECAQPDTAVGMIWFRIMAVPVEEMGTASALERFLRAASGTGGTIVFRLGHTDASGIKWSVGLGDEAAARRCQLMLAPFYDLEPEPEPELTGGLCAGVVHRVRPLLNGDSPGSPRGVSLLELLPSVNGQWSVELRCSAQRPGVLESAEDLLVDLEEHAAERLTRTQQVTGTVSSSTTSAAWSLVIDHVAAFRRLVSLMEARGGWAVDTWVTARTEPELDAVLACLHGLLGQEDGLHVMTRDLEVSQMCGAPAPTSLLDSRTLAGVMASPGASVPGLLSRPALPAHRHGVDNVRPLDLGRAWGTDLRAHIGLGDLEGHAFLTGTTGSGKSTSLLRLLSQVWNRHHVPFLLIDPVKDEYERVADRFDGGLTLVRGRDVRLDLMRAQEGEDQADHLARVAQAFVGSFAMPSPAPYVVTKLFDRIAEQPGGPRGATLHDVRSLLDPIAASLGYAGEPQANIRAIIATRLDLLLAPLRAARLCSPNSSMISQLMTGPVVLSLADMGDDEERSFLVLVLAMAVRAIARRRDAIGGVRHLLVLEEAHRVIPDIPQSAELEASSANKVSADLLSGMLAEVRAYGEQVVVVDQSPSRVSPEVLRNTNLKIVHRVVHPDDQVRVAGAMSMLPEESRGLGLLCAGQAVISTRARPQPQTVAVSTAEPSLQAGASRRIVSSPADWPCCHGVEDSHFRAWSQADAAAPHLGLFLAGAREGAGDGDALRRCVHTALAALAPPLQTGVPCLVWAGLRRLLVQERLEGLLADARAVDKALVAAFELWESGRGVTREAGLDFSVPLVRNRRICPWCGEVCALGIVTRTQYEAGPGLGLRLMETNRWRDRAQDVERHIRNETLRLEPLLGVGTAHHVMRCQIRQITVRNMVHEAFADSLIRACGVEN